MYSEGSNTGYIYLYMEYTFLYFYTENKYIYILWKYEI